MQAIRAKQTSGNCGSAKSKGILSKTGAFRVDVDRLVAAGRASDQSVLADYPNPRSVCVFVGPEGDFTPAELALAKSVGCRPVTLGPIILRAETAALYCLSVLAHELF